MPRYDFEISHSIRINAPTLADAVNQIKVKDSPYVQALLAHAKISSPDCADVTAIGEHVHNFADEQYNGYGTERIRVCECGATMDSDGGVMEA